MKPWQKFERLVVESMPLSARCLRLNTPTPFDPSAKSLARFTAKPPYDLSVSIPSGAIAAQPFDERLVAARFNFALELKSCREYRLEFDRVKKHQIDGLLQAREFGEIAGLLVEYRESDARPGVVMFYPVGAYLSYMSRESRASMPASAPFGIMIHYQPLAGRQRIHRLDMGRFFDEVLQRGRN